MERNGFVEKQVFVSQSKNHFGISSITKNYTSGLGISFNHHVFSLAFYQTYIQHRMYFLNLYTEAPTSGPEPPPLLLLLQGAELLGLLISGS